MYQYQTIPGGKYVLSIDNHAEIVAALTAL